VPLTTVAVLDALLGISHGLFTSAIAHSQIRPPS
jgi:hypothetical protein